MMYLPNRNLELFGEPPSLDEPNDNELNVLDRLEKFSQIEIPSYRQQACIDMDEALNYCQTKEDFDRIKDIATELAADQDLNVRVSLLDQFQFIGVRCLTSTSCRATLFQFITSCLKSSLRDQNHQVRKSAQSVLILLTNQGFYSKRDLETLYVDIIQDMLMPDTNTHELNDFPPEAITLISALALHLGGDIIVKKFLDRYIELCSDSLLHVRKCCASSFPKICQVIGNKVVEQKLLPIFSQLCNDDIWGVRKACAEGFTMISSTIQQTVRVQLLTPLFLQLLNDTSRYVKLAAYQQLGPFITTFQNGDIKEVETLEAVKEPRERSPTNPEYDDFLFWKSPVNTDTDALEEELYGESDDVETSEKLAASPDSNEQTDAQTKVQTDAQTNIQTNAPANTLSAPQTAVQTDGIGLDDVTMEAEVENKAQAVSTAAVSSAGVSTQEEVMMSNLEAKMTDATNKEEFNAMFHGSEDVDMETVQIDADEEGMKLRKYFLGLLKQTEDKENVDNQENGSGSQEQKEAGCSEEEVFDNDLPVVKSPVWGLASPDQDSQSATDPLAPKIAPASDNTDQEKEAVSSDGVMVGTIDITKPVFGVEVNENENEMAYSFSQKDDALDLASDSSDMDTESIIVPTVSSPVPGALIDCYTNMANNVDENNHRADDDILTHCAYAFPGVVYTLGKDSWQLLRSTYLTLAENLPHSMSNVRQTLACSLHEIAHVIGPELTQQDLIHPFNSFIYDIDSVKIGLLKNLSKFLQHVSSRHRQELLHQMKEIQKCEDRKNWRYRQTFASQLAHLSTLYTTKEVYEHIQPIVVNLTMDHVYQVRYASFKALSKLLDRFKSESATEYYDSTCQIAKEKFALSNKCTFRQSYAFICLELIRDEKYDIMETSLLESLLGLANDRTPNVRLWVGQCLLLLRDKIKNEQITTSLTQLQSDSDHDVRHYSTHIAYIVDPDS